MKEIFLYVIVCVVPITNPEKDCTDVATYEAQDPIQCQLDRILVSGAWRREIEDKHGKGYAIFTGCAGDGIEEFLSED